MAFDTTVGGADADSYVSLDEAEAYHGDRGNAAWTSLSSDTAKQQLLIKGSQYLDAHWRVWWKGRRATTEQALAWPREHVHDEDDRPVDDTIIPRMVKYATCEAALAELSDPGVLFPAEPRETKMERVGPITIEYVPGADQRTLLTAVRDLLTGLLKFDGTNTGFLLRA